MRNIRLCTGAVSACVALFSLLLMPTSAAAQDFNDLRQNGDLDLRGIGSFFIEGDTHAISVHTARGGFPGSPGLSMYNQMHVQYMLPEKKSKEPPAARHRAWLLPDDEVVADDARRPHGLGRVLRPPRLRHLHDRSGRPRPLGLRCDRLQQGADRRVVLHPWDESDGGAGRLPGNSRHPDRLRPVRLEHVPLGHHAVHRVAVFRDDDAASRPSSSRSRPSASARTRTCNSTTWSSPT